MRNWTVRIVLGVLVLTILSGGVAYVFVKSAVVEMFGGRTEIAENKLPISASGDFFIANVNVLAPSADTFLDGRVVGVKDGTISYLGDKSGVPDDAEILDGRGMFLVPGFTDSHVHLWRSENDLLLYLANGVTQIREMHGIDLHLQWKSEIQNGRLGPDMYVVAAQLATYNFAEGLWVDVTAERNVVRSERGVRRTIASLRTDGFDAMKSSSFLGLPSYQWMSAETSEHDIPFTGHIPIAASLPDLWASNQKEVAHIEEFVKALDREYGGYSLETADDFLTYVNARSADIARSIRANDIYVTSTLAIIQSFAPQKTELAKTLGEKKLDYVNPGVAEGQAMGWLPDVNRYRIADQYKTEGWRDRSRAYWGTYVEAHLILLSAFLAADVPMMVGTDANVPVMVPGFSLHEEMMALNEAGMSPAEVLASATVVPAEWMGWRTGKISEGYDANLVLLRENPLVDIDATDEIEMVFVNGHVLDRSDLDELLFSVKSANDASREIDLSAFE